MLCTKPKSTRLIEISMGTPNVLHRVLLNVIMMMSSQHELKWKSNFQVSYANPKELWQSVSGQIEKSWYAPAVEYWDNQPASYDGVLAGMSQPFLKIDTLRMFCQVVVTDNCACRMPKPSSQ